MFTGIIREIGKLESLQMRGQTCGLEIQAPNLRQEGISEGDSIAVNGICLTIVSLGKTGFKTEASWETIQRTTLRRWQDGERLNLERALPMNGRLDGHWVAGHVDGTAEIRSLRPQGEGILAEVEAPAGTMKYLARKGSVALDGISLTVAELTGERTFAVAIIPYTLRQTTLGNLRPGIQVNLEVDLIARYLERLFARQGAGQSLDWQQLIENGFISGREAEKPAW